MSTLNWTVHHKSLELAKPLRTAAGTINQRDIWLLQVDDGSNRGWGEAAPLPGFGGESAEQCTQALAHLPSNGPDAMAAALGWAETPAAAQAVLAALSDLTARKGKRPLATHLALSMGIQPSKRLRLATLIQGPDPAAAASAAAQGFAACKWKSSGDPRQDANDARILFDAVGSEISLRIDANGMWDEDGARAFGAEAARLVDFVEQPFPRGEESCLPALAEVQLRAALDESVRTADEAIHAIQAWHCEVLVLKPGWFGGWPQLRRAVDLARGMHRRVIISDCLGSGLGRLHAGHAALALGLDSECHGLGTAGLTTNDPLPEALGGPQWKPGEAIGVGAEPVLES